MKSKIALVVLMALSTMAVGQKKMSQSIGKMLNYNKVNEPVLIQAINAKLEITAFSPEIIRVRMTKDNFLDNFSYAVILQQTVKFVVGKNIEVTTQLVDGLMQIKL